ncbi:MAG: phosphodiester glycosidase family protein [Proteobacteria bacterium]|nr:phosphodiester glycosidase family protein [Pseudomonadota bacterium]
MRISLIFFLLCFLWSIPVYAESICAKSCSSDSGEVFHGIDYCHIEDSTHQIFVLKVDLQAKGVVPYVTPNLKGKKITPSKFVSQYGVKVAINTAFFDKKGYALGYQKSNGEVYGDNTRKTIGFDKNNKYYQGDSSSVRKLMYNATSGSNWLLKDGKKVDNGNGSFSKTTHPRTAVGIDKTGRYFYMIVVDGRRKKRVGMSLSALSDCLLALGAYNGVNMDGGGSSAMVISGKGAVNSPSDGHERSVPTHLGFFADAACTPSAETCNSIDDDCDGEVDEDNVCCVPEPEICDEKDNDCDGEVDEDNVCCVPEPEVCDEKDNDCDGEVDEDNVCCVPEPEVCDEKDNDCDGQVDEDNVCCVPEICDGKDNDCDGQVDEDNVCCVPEPEVCDEKDNDCDGQVDEDNVCCVPEPEVCDEKDNDCDGKIDEDDVCETPEDCIPSDEICDGKDNDCDGKTDEDDVCETSEECIPSKEICDGKDNDCDGKIDENCYTEADVLVYNEEDCGCDTTKRRSSPPSLFAIGLLLAGILRLRRKQRTTNN